MVSVRLASSTPLTNNKPEAPAPTGAAGDSEGAFESARVIGPKLYDC